MNSDVTTFLDEQNHPFRAEIQLLRDVILDANAALTENIKWNGPNYCYNNEDRITMKINPPKLIQLIFHRGAKKLAQPKNRLIADSSGLLVWKENDRAIASFKTIQDIESAKAALQTIINEWIKQSV
jgi:hypothetical protein